MRDVLLRIDDPAPGLAIVSVFSERRFTSVQACLYRGEAAAVSEREEPAWSAWMQERFPADGGGGSRSYWHKATRRRRCAH